LSIRCPGIRARLQPDAARYDTGGFSQILEVRSGYGGGHDRRGADHGAGGGSRVAAGAAGSAEILGIRELDRGLRAGRGLSYGLVLLPWETVWVITSMVRPLASVSPKRKIEPQMDAD